MHSNRIRKGLTALIIIFGVLNLFQAMCFIGAGGILNELDSALLEIEGLEKQSLLKPENVSNNARWVFTMYRDSSGIKQHIKEYEASLGNQLIFFCMTIILFLLSLILRIYFRLLGKSSGKRLCGSPSLMGKQKTEGTRGKRW